MSLVIKICLTFALLLLFSFSNQKLNKDLNGVWKVLDITLNSEAELENQEAILSFLENSNPTSIEFKIVKGQGSYSVFSNEKLLEQSLITYKNGIVCKEGVSDCANVVFSLPKCELIFKNFTYSLSK